MVGRSGREPGAIAVGTVEPHTGERLLLERERELTALNAAIFAAARGEGRTLLIQAQPGLGKTRLLDAAAERSRAQQRLSVARFTCGELERQLPWVGAAGLLAGLMESFERRDWLRLLNGAAAPAAFLFDQAQPPSADGDGYEVIRGLFEIVAESARKRPVVLLLDDAHWCDSASLHFLVYLQRRVPELAVSLIVAMRPSLGESAALLDRLAAESGTEILRPGALGVESVTTLVRHEAFPDAPGTFGRLCWQMTSGNPFYLHELVLELCAEYSDPDSAAAALAAAAPASVARSVLVRLGQLAVPGALELVRAAAVLGDGAALRHIGRLAELDAPDLESGADALADAELLAPGEPVRFVHPLVRAAIYADIPAAQRARLHARAAALLAADDASPDLIAVQLMRAPRDGSSETVTLLQTAAARAAGRGAPQVATEYLRRALDEPPATELRPAILLELGRLEAALGDAAAVSRLSEALELATDHPQRGEILLELGWAEHHAGRFAAAAAAFERGLAEVADDRIDLADALEAGYVLSAMYDVTRSAHAQSRVRAIEERSPAGHGPAQRALLGQLLVARAMAGRSHGEVLELARRLWDGGRLLEEEGPDSQTLWHVVGVLSWSDAFAEALQIVDLALDQARRRGSALAEARARYARSWPRYWTGDLAGAEADARAAIDTWSGGLETYLPAAVYWLVLALLERDMPEEATRALLAAGPRERWEGTAFVGFLLAAEGHLASSRGEPEQALAHHLDCGRVAEQLHFRNPAIMPWRSQAALAARITNELEMARQLAAEEVKLARQYGAARALGAALRTAGLTESGDAGLRLLREAEAVLAPSGAGLEHARALVDLGAATRRAGQRAAARPYLKRGLEIAQSAGATSLARHAQTELRAAGGRARRSITTGVESLTASERRVAELAAAGHTNRHIAQSLHVSTKAVEWHLHQTYLKLGISSRRGLPHHLSPDTHQGA